MLLLTLYFSRFLDIKQNVFFRANWKKQFKKTLTGPMEFNLLGGHEKIFHLKGMRLAAPALLRTARLPGLGARILELPYEISDFNMYVGIPEENSLEALNKLTHNFEFARFKDKLSYNNVDVLMPAFDAGYEDTLNEPLTRMGIQDLFDESKADLTDMTDERVAVTSVIHEAVVKVNEEGSEAAAATAAVVGIRSGGADLEQEVEVFNVDRPFVFMIHDKGHDIPLFVGRMVNPAGQDNPGATIRHDRSPEPEILAADAPREAQLALNQARRPCHCPRLRGLGLSRRPRHRQRQFPL